MGTGYLAFMSCLWEFLKQLVITVKEDVRLDAFGVLSSRAHLLFLLPSDPTLRQIGYSVLLSHEPFHVLLW